MVKKSIFFIIIISILTFSALDAYAEIKRIIQTVRQSFSGTQSPDEARQAAIAKAKREALEKAGTYLDSITVVKNGVVELDEIVMLTSGIIKLEILSQKNYVNGDSFGVIISTQVTIDTDVLNKRVEDYVRRRHILLKEKDKTPSHKYSKDKTIISWFDDKEFLELSYREKERIIITHFNANYTDKEFYDQPLTKQYKIINNFVRAHIGDE